MLATAVASSMNSSGGHESDLASLSSLTSLASSPLSGVSEDLAVESSILTTGMGDTDLTNLGWLQQPGVLTAMCTTLTGQTVEQGGVKVGTSSVRSTRKPRQPKGPGEPGKMDPFKSRCHPRTSDKMVNVILNVRNRKYNGEDASKPPLSFACMIFMAVESSPTKTLPVKGIYDWVMWKFPYYRAAPPGWKNSVRHNLSLNKCFKKVDRYSSKSSSAISKGGLWTVDPDYRRSLLAALKRSPYHPYHSYFSPPLSPSSSSSLDDLGPAERDAALTMCMIGGGTDEVGGDLLGTELLHAIYHDHCYTRDPPRPPPVCMAPPTSQQVTVKLTNGARKSPSGLTLDEIVAAAEMILAQDEEEGVVTDGSATSSDQSSDEGLGGEVDTDMEEEGVESVGGVSCGEALGDSGYAGSRSPSDSSGIISSQEEMGVDALLCLAAAATSPSIS